MEHEVFVEEDSVETLTFDDSKNTPTNVADAFANLSTEQVKEAIAGGLSPMVTICMNLTSDFNKATVLRAHNAFLGSDFYVVGRRSFDRRGTVGMHHYTTVKHAETIEPVVAFLREQGYTIFAVDNTPKFSPLPVYEAAFPRKSAFIYGEEKLGLDENTVALCDQAVYIPQRGVPRSINVSNAAAIMMSEYTRRHPLM
jgi:tRNA G18 (ribose-2'-O)-methylase SpoU